MRRKSSRSTQTQLQGTAKITRTHLQTMVNQDDVQSTLISEDSLALEMQLEITQGKVINLMTEKRMLLDKIKSYSAEAAVKIRELATMGELIIGIDAEKVSLEKKLNALDEKLEKTKESLYKAEQNNKLLADENIKLQESLTTRFDELANLAKLLENSERTLMVREAELDKSKKALERVKNTVSWKATTPVRLISKQFKKKKKNNKTEEFSNLIGGSGLFNIEWYLKNCPELSGLPINPIEHYLSVGYKMGLNPSEKFNGNLYMERYPDVAQEGVNPLVHYILFGKDEGRTI